MGDTQDLCSLSEADFAGREAEWHALLRQSVRTVRERDDGFELSLEPRDGVFEELQRLAALEDRRCGWMRVSIADGNPIALRITASAAGGKDVIALLIPPSVRNAAASGQQK
jgi:hypothetical protein